MAQLTSGLFCQMLMVRAVANDTLRGNKQKGEA